MPVFSRLKRFYYYYIFLASLLPVACSTSSVRQATAGGEREAAVSVAVAGFINNGIVQQKGCLTCHSIGGKGGTVGPGLDQVGNRRSADWLRRWLINPNDVKNGTRMPNFQFSEQELNELVDVLSRLKKEFDPQMILAGSGNPAEKGEQLFKSYDCFACHRIGSKGRFIGPNLTWLGRRKSVEWEKNWLKNPPAYKPDTFMPDFGLTPGEIEALAAFVTSQQGQRNSEVKKWEENVIFFLDSRPREIGEMFYRRFGCDGCHGRRGESGYRNPNAAPKEQMPRLTRVARKMDKAQLTDWLMSGHRPQRLATEGSEPLSCPDWKGAVTGDEAGYIYDFLLSIAPKKKRFKFGG